MYCMQSNDFVHCKIRDFELKNLRSFASAIILTRITSDHNTC